MLPICIYIVQSYFGVLYFYHLLSSLPQIQKQFHFAAPRDFQETFQTLPEVPPSIKKVQRRRYFSVWNISSFLFKRFGIFHLFIFLTISLFFLQNINIFFFVVIKRFTLCILYRDYKKNYRRENKMIFHFDYKRSTVMITFQGYNNDRK